MKVRASPVKATAHEGNAMLMKQKRRRPKLSAGMTSERVMAIACAAARVAGERLQVDLQAQSRARRSS